MADGQGYSTNAQKAAASGPDCSSGGCEACVKTGLPVLLVRPGLVDKATAEEAGGTIEKLLPGVADPKLTYAGYAMRTLRKGYLYAYYEEPHTAQIKAQNGWQAFRVDDGGYLTPTTLAALSSEVVPEFACVRASSYATAMLFVIPDATNTGKVWVGFSGSPWSQETLDNYGGDEGAVLREQRMACINAKKGESDRSISLNAGNVEAGIVDYMPNLSDEALRGNPYPRRPLMAVSKDGSVGRAANELRQESGTTELFSARPMKGRPESANSLLEQAKKLVAQDSTKTYTDANLMIVSVPDAEGVTHEAAVRRVTLCNTAAEWVAHFPNGDWMMKSALHAKGMLDLIGRQGEDKKTQYAAANYSQYDGRRMHISEFNTLKNAGKLPPDAEFIPQTSHDGMARTSDYSKPGRVSVPGDDDIDRATAGLQDEVRGQLTHRVEGLDYLGFLDLYNRKSQADKDRLARVELDYLAWLQGQPLKLLTCHDFSAASQDDGWHYAQCIRLLTYGGPLTDKGFEVFKPLINGDASDTNALITRALLGNRPEFFSWLREAEQVSKAYDTAKGLFDLEPVQKALERADFASKWVGKAQLAAAELQAVASATLAGLDKLDQLGEKLRYQYELLSMMLMTKSEAMPIQLLQLKVSLQEATRIWNNLLSDAADIAQRASEVGGRRVQSLVMGVASAVEMHAGSAAAMTTIDVYLLASGNDATWQKYLSPVKSAGHRYVVQPFKAGGAAAAQYIDDIGLRALTRNTAQVLRTGSGALTAGAGLLQVVLLGKAWKQYRDGSADERQSAAVAMLTSGLGVSSALMEMSSIAMQKAGRELAEQSLKRVAGVIAAGATAIDAVQAFVNASKAQRSGDEASVAGYIFQGVVFAGAAFAIYGATMAATGTGSFLGMSALALTGWGLLLIGLGVLVGFLIMVLKDKPVEAWAAKTFWGDADTGEKWGSYKREVQEANKTLAGVTVDFTYRYSALQKAVIAGTMSNPLLWGAEAIGRTLGLPTPAGLAMQTREIWFRLQMPKELRAQLPWRVRLYAVGPEGTTRIGSAAGDGSGGVGYDAEFPPGVSDFSYEESEDGNQAILSADLDTARYRQAWAHIEIFISAAAGDLFHGAVGNGETTVLLVDQEIRE